MEPENQLPAIEDIITANGLAVRQVSPDETSEIAKLKDRLARESKLVVDLQEEVDRLRPVEEENARLRLLVMPPCDEKAEGIRRASFDALENFFGAMREMREAAKRDYGAREEGRALVSTMGASMFLPADLKSATESVLPMIDALEELDELGYLERRYGGSWRGDAEEFVALTIVLRTVGLPKKEKSSR